MYNVTQKTVYDWINTGRLDVIEFSERKWLDQTVTVRPSVKQAYNLSKQPILTAKHL